MEQPQASAVPQLSISRRPADLTRLSSVQPLTIHRRPADLIRLSSVRKLTTRRNHLSNSTCKRDSNKFSVQNTGALLRQYRLVGPEYLDPNAPIRLRPSPEYYSPPLNDEPDAADRIGVEEESYQCASEHCRNTGKLWPRLEDFEQHINRMHKEEDSRDLIKR
jgi:hypothetical protein